MAEITRHVDNQIDSRRLVKKYIDDTIGLFGLSRFCVKPKVGTV